MGWIGDGGWWLIAAVLLSIAELLVPGVFLVFVAIAAGITGILALLFPELGIAGELLAFIGWAIVAVLIGRRWYRDYPVETIDPKLNDRIARLIGDTVIVTQTIADGAGRVRVGDGEWPARGDDAPVGSRVRIIGGEDGALRVAIITATTAPSNPVEK